MSRGRKPWGTRLIEVLWTGLGVIALVAATGTWYEARTDSFVITRLPTYRVDSPRAVILRSSERTAFCRMLVQIAFLFAGLLSLLTPQPIRMVNQRTGTIASVVFIASELLLAWDAVSERRDRQTINRMLDLLRLRRAAHIVLHQKEIPHDSHSE